ncbi:MAG: methyltransferase domain-containing protein [Bacteroidia bacterium]|nr:methyltransferase domain-containing protein [Bacteroidia bacterium]
MEKYKLLMKIKELYSKGENIIQYLKNLEGSEINTPEDILIGYDFQAGIYIKRYSLNLEYRKKYCQALAKIIERLGPAKSLIEAGVGEATTLGLLLQMLNTHPSAIFGFDISWSRLKFAKGLLNDFNFKTVKLFTANLFEIPLPDNSVDIVYTSHSIEPNGGQEGPVLKELYRITRKYLILLEPAYELANEEAKERIRRYGFVTNLYSTAKELGYKIIEYRLFDVSLNPLNTTGLIIIEKNDNRCEIAGNSELVCPVTKTALQNYNDSLLYSEQSFLAYPVIEGIPCLLNENAILAVHLLTDYDKFKSTNNIIFM